MILFFAGAESKQNREDLFDAGAEAILESAYTLKYKKAPSIGEFKYHLLDSGGFVARIKHKEVFVDKYCEFINSCSAKLCFNLDVTDIETTMKNQEYLEKNTSAKIIPVYHATEYFSDDREWLDELVKKYDYIGIGGLAGANIKKAERNNFLNYVFSKTQDKVRVHGLAVYNTSEWNRYPFYSVDATSWLQGSQYGTGIFEFYDGKIKKLKGHTKKTHYSYKNKQIARAYILAAKYYTKLWQKRGVTWKDIIL